MDRNAAALAMAIEIRRKNKRKPAPVTSELIEEPEDPLDDIPSDGLDVEAPAVVEAVSESPQVGHGRSASFEDARAMARRIMAKRKPVAKPEESIDELDFEPAPEPAAPRPSSSERIAKIMARLQK